MAEDKRKRRRLKSLPAREQRLLTFGLFAASLEIPPEERAAQMEEGLRFFIELLHRDGYAAPRWLLKPYWYFKRGLSIRDDRERPGAHFVLGLAEGLVEDVPEGERQEAIRDLLHVCAGIYAEGDMEPPEWLRLGLERYGEEELPVEVMLDVLDASLRNLPEAGRPQARRDALEHYAGLYAERGLPVPEWVRVGLKGAPPAM